MFIYSGKCRLCETGIPTELKDDQGGTLQTGDIVILYIYDEESGIESFDGLTVIVAYHYDNYSGHSPKKKENPGDAFVMGIKSVSLRGDLNKAGDDGQSWRVRVVKEAKDVIPGERWPDFGFHYSEI